MKNSRKPKVNSVIDALRKEHGEDFLKELHGTLGSKYQPNGMPSHLEPHQIPLPGIYPCYMDIKAHCIVTYTPFGVRITSLKVE